MTHGGRSTEQSQRVFSVSVLTQPEKKCFSAVGKSSGKSVINYAITYVITQTSFDEHSTILNANVNGLKYASLLTQY